MAADYRLDRASGRYRDVGTGRYVSERQVRDAVDRLADLASERMARLTARFRAGELTALAWQAELQATVKASQVAAALAAYGGPAEMTPARWGLVGSQVRVQYAYLRQFAADVLAGRQRMNGRMDARARQYGQAARALYENVRRHERGEAAARYERNLLGAADQHCPDCRRETARGWVPLGSLVPVGQRRCRAGCRCTLAYARAASEPAVEVA